MIKKPQIKVNLKKEATNIHSELLTLKQSLVDFKAQRKTEWRSFKKKMNDDISKLEKSISQIKATKK